MYITEKMWYTPNNRRVHIQLIWKTQDAKFSRDVVRYRNGKIIAIIQPSNFVYTRRGDYLVAATHGSPDLYPGLWSGIGEWRIDPNIRGNVRGCV